jgi:hypothetical protein
LGASQTLSLARREEYRLQEFKKGAEEGIRACGSVRRRRIQTLAGGKPMEGDHFEELEVSGRITRDRTYTCNVIMWRVRVTVVAVEKQQCIIS